MRGHNHRRHSPPSVPCVVGNKQVAAGYRGCDYHVSMAEGHVRVYPPHSGTKLKIWAFHTKMSPGHAC